MCFPPLLHVREESACLTGPHEIGNTELYKGQHWSVESMSEIKEGLLSCTRSAHSPGLSRRFIWDSASMLCSSKSPQTQRCRTIQCLRDLSLASLKQSTGMHSWSCGSCCLHQSVALYCILSWQPSLVSSLWPHLEGLVGFTWKLPVSVSGRLHVFSHIRQHDYLLAALTEALISLPLRSVNYLD